MRSLEKSKYVGGDSRELGQFDVDTLSFATMCWYIANVLGINRVQGIFYKENNVFFSIWDDLNEWGL